MTMLDYILSLDKPGAVLRREGEVLHFSPNPEKWTGAGRDIQELLGALPQWYGTGGVVEPGDALLPETLELLGSIELRLDPGLEDYTGDAYRPCYRLRGRPVTPEQAREIIRRTDWLLGSLHWHAVYQELKGPLFPGFVGGDHFIQRWFDTENYPCPYGWSHPDGTIGLNSITSLYPEFNDLLCEALALKSAFPWLDMCVAVSSYCDIRMVRVKEGDRARGGTYSTDKASDEDFAQHLELGFCLHEDVLEVLGPEHAAERYLDYARRYTPENREMLEPEYYELNDFINGARVCDEAYLLACLRDWGLEEEAARELLKTRADCHWEDTIFPREDKEQEDGT